MSWALRFLLISVAYWAIGFFVLVFVAISLDGVPDGHNIANGYASVIALLALALGYGLLVRQMRISQQGGYRDRSE